MVRKRSIKMQSKTIRSVFWVGICFLSLLLIFHNSMYPIVQSDQQSGAVLNVLNRFFAANGLDVVLSQFVVRKLAHFIEYLIFGFLLTVTFQVIWKKRNNFFFAELFLVLAFPVVDETIQLSYPGRGSSVGDVLIDFVSCIVGMGICRSISRNSIGSSRGSRVLETKPEFVITPRDRDRSKRWIFTAITILFILFIFYNSLLPGPQSSAQSRYVMNLLNHLLGALRSTVILSEHFVRKAGHFTEYFLLGILFLFTVRSYHKPARESVFAGMFFLLFVPVIDEFLQVFTPQRGSSVLDVLLDFSGGIAGAAVCWLISDFKIRSDDTPLLTGHSC